MLFTLVKNCSPADLGPILSDVFVTLIPLLSELPELVVQIYHYMIVENAALLQPYFKDIPFVPDHPKLTEIKAQLFCLLLRLHAISKRDQRMVMLPSDRSLSQQLQQLCKCLSSDNVAIRKLTLQRIHTLLNENRAAVLLFFRTFLFFCVFSNLVQITALLQEQERVHPDINHLLKKLLIGCRDTTSGDGDLKRLHAVVLGQLGAIDPGRLPDLGVLREQVPQDRSDLELAFVLIQVLALTFRFTL